MVKYLLISIVLFACISLNASIPPQVCPDCVLIYPHDPENGYFNPDSVLIDTTNGINTLYAKGTYSVIFSVMPFTLPIVNGDTVLQFTRFDIDTNYASIRQAFDSLYSLYGSMTFYKHYYPYFNTSSLEYFRFDFKFNGYAPIQSVVEFLHLTELTNFATYNYLYNDESDFYPEFQGPPPQDKLVIHQRLKDNWHLKQARFPMAFNITEGDANIVIAIAENWGGNQNVYLGNQSEISPSQKDELGYGIGDGFKQSQDAFPSDPDYYDLNFPGNLYHKIKIRDNMNHLYHYYKIYDNDNDNSTKAGNYILNLTPTVNTVNTSIYRVDKGYGSGYPQLLINMGNYHGIATSMTALSKNNGKFITGSCPNCMGIGINAGWPATKIDIDPFNGDDSEGNRIIDKPQILSMSLKSGSYDRDKVIYPSILSGTVVITANYKATYSHDSHISNNYFNDLKTINVWPYQDRYCISETLPPTCDYKRDPNCIPCENPLCPEWDFRIKLQSDNKYWFQGFSPFDNKYDFNISKNASLYLPITGNGRKNTNLGIRDVIAPNPSIVPWPTIEYPREPGTPGGYSVKKDYDGGSNSIPVVSGTVGLMLSIDSVLNLDVSSASERYLIPNKVYDIITFTAKKPYYLDSDLENGELKDTRRHLEYINLDFASNDPLKRYFSKTYTFGILNAYRAVAHSFRNKGKSTPYIESDLLKNSFRRSDGGNTLGYINSENKELLHFGAFNVNRETVLKKGGNRYVHHTNPDRIPIFDNCYGTTIINTDLVVEKNHEDSDGAILAIDGILKSTTDCTTPCQKRITNNLNVNKLMISGFIEGIGIEGGSIFTDDVHIFKKSTGEIGEFLFNANKETAGKSFAHGTIYLHDNSKVTVFNDAEFEMTTGSAIYMYDDAEVVIEDGGVLRMDYMTKFKAFNGNKIVIKPGGKLVIGSGAIALFETYIEIQGTQQKPGILELEEKTLVYIDSIVMKPYGKLVLNENEAIIMGGEYKERPSLKMMDRYYDGLLVLEKDVVFNVYPFEDPEQPVRLIGGVRVKPGAVFNVAPQAYLHLGPFYVDSADFNTPGGIMNINREAFVQLFGANNYVKGTFITGIGADVENPNTWPYIGGFEGDHPYACDKPNFLNFAKIEVKHEPLLYGISSLTDLDTLIPNRDYLQLEKTKFEHLGFKGIDAITMPIQNCNFVTNSKKIKDAHDNKYLNQTKLLGAFLDFEILDDTGISLRQTGLPKYAFMDNWQRVKSINSYRSTDYYTYFNDKHFLNNNFEDENPVKVYITRKNKKPNEHGEFHNMGGIRMDRIQIAYVIGKIVNNEYTCSFDNLLCGVWFGKATGYMLVNDYLFQTCETAINAIESIVYPCNNTIQEAVVGLALTSTFANISNDNKFITTKYAVELKDARPMFRGDKFTDFQAAIFVRDNSHAILSSSFYNPAYSNLVEDYGRCEFDYANLFFEEPSLRSERFEGVPLNNRMHSDILFDDDDASVYLKCGYNLFSRYIPLPPTPHYEIFHLSTTPEVTVPIGPIYTINNEWRPNLPGLVKYYGNHIVVNPMNPNNTSESVTGCETSMFFHDENCFEEQRKCTGCIDDIKHWASIRVPNNVFFDNVAGLVTPFSEITDNSNQFLIKDVMLYAILADSSDLCLQIFIDTLSSIIADTTFPEFYRNSAQFYMGESYERLGDINSANNVYNDFIASNPSENVMMTLEWRLQYNSCYEIDSTMGSTYDSCRYAYMDRVIYDLSRDILNQPPPKISEHDLNGESNFSFEIELVKPNPFTEKTDIHYYISEKSKVKLSVLDIFGRELIKLVDNQEQFGHQSIILDGTKLPNGVYLLILQAEGISKTVPIIKYN